MSRSNEQSISSEEVRPQLTSSRNNRVSVDSSSGNRSDGNQHATTDGTTNESGSSRAGESDEPLHDYTADLAASRAGRRSRASSIFSTRTHLTNYTMDDTRSIEIVAGGQSFRISRDGSRVTDITAPPPYPGPPHEDILEDEHDTENYVDLSNPSEASATAESDQQTPRLDPQKPSLDEDIDQDLSLSSSSSRLDISSSVFELPAKLKRAFGVNGLLVSHTAANVEVPSSSDVPIPPPPPRRTLSDTSNYKWFRPWSRASAEDLASVNKSQSSQMIEDDQRSVTSPEYDQKDMMVGLGSNFEAHKRGISHRSLPEKIDLSYSNSTISESEEDESEEVQDERAAEMRTQYSRIIRDLDQEYRDKLAQRNQEVSRLSHALNAKDAAYRRVYKDQDTTIQELRSYGVTRERLIVNLKEELQNITEDFRSQVAGKDGMIEMLKIQLAQAEDEIQRKLEQARNTVEDMWEKKWKEHEKLLLEKLRQNSNDIG